MPGANNPSTAFSKTNQKPQNDRPIGDTWAKQQTVKLTEENKLKQGMMQRADVLTTLPTERYKPTALTMGNVGFRNAEAARAELTPQTQMDYLTAVKRAEGAAQQTDYLDPRMQQYLQQSMQLNQGVLDGTAPSLATSQLRSGVDESIRAQMAMAGSGGMNPAMMRGAQQQGAMSLQQAANQASAIRAQEVAQARAAQQGAYENAAQMTLAGSQFQTQAQQNAMNQYLNAQQNYAGMEQDRAMQNAQFAQQTGLQNQQLGLQTQQFNIQNQYDVAKMNELMKAQEFEQYMTNQYNRQALGANYYNTILTGQNAALSLQQQRAIAAEQAAGQRDASNKQMIGAGIGAAAVIGAAALSDKRAKKNIKDNNETVAFLNALTDNSYDYKQPNAVGAAQGRQYGPMAQDLEKTNMGKTAVIEADGGKMIDTNRAMLLALSGLSNINARLNMLEGKKNA
jgi:hypothetical protein